MAKVITSKECYNYSCTKCPAANEESNKYWGKIKHRLIIRIEEV